MKITMYELLGMIKDGKAPRKIKYDDEIWNYKEGINRYISENDDYCLGGFDFDELNDEVEIIEPQEHKIPEKLSYYSLEKIQKAKNKDEWREERISLLEERVDDYHDKINEIIDYLEEIE